jgi:hypothetical protein
MYTRGRATPTNPNTSAQQEARNVMSALATSWKNLSVAGRGGWEQYAENTPVTDVFGEPLVLTGQQMYIRCQSPRLRSGLASVSAAPTTFGQGDLTTLTLTDAGSGNLNLNYDNTDTWAGAPGGALIIQTSQIVAPTVNFLAGPYRWLANIFGAATPPTSPAQITVNAMGMTLATYAGNKLFVRVRSTDADGKLSPVHILSATIVTP